MAYLPADPLLTAMFNAKVAVFTLIDDGPNKELERVTLSVADFGAAIDKAQQRVGEVKGALAAGKSCAPQGFGWP